MRKKAIFVANTGFALFNFRLPLMQHLYRHGWNIAALACDEGGYSDRFSKEGFRFINMFIDHKGKNPLNDLLFAFKLKRLYDSEAPEVVHHFTIKPVIFGSVAAKLANVPAIVNTITGLGYSFQKGGWLKRFVTKLYKMALAGRPETIFQNNDDYRVFLSEGIIEKDQGHVILSSGVNTEVIHPTYSERDKNQPHFVLISRMLWSKGISEFVKAAEYVKKNFPEVEFIMAGGHSGGGADGNPEAIPKDWLKAVNEKGYVKWVGRVPAGEVMGLLEKADVTVLPSYGEGVPRSLIEAAAKGKAIITTDTPGCREVVDHGVNGFLVPPKNVDELTGRLLELIRNPHMIKQMGQASRKKAEDLFDEKKILAQIATVYRQAGVRI